MDENTIYNIVINKQRQYSIWWVDRDFPVGWKPIGFSGTRDKCLIEIDRVWTDMRPLSLRNKMELLRKRLPLDR